MMAARQVTDRAKRYRAQNAVTGPRKCVICGSRSDLGVMHLTGNESHGEAANLAYGCRSCNGKLAAAFKSIGAGRPTNQYNPAKGVPTFEQYMWAVTHHTRTEHDEGGAVIHATPKHKRIEYAKRIASGKSRENPWPFSRPDARRTTPAHGGIAYHQGKAKPRKRADDLNAEFLKSTKKSKPAKAASSMPDEAALQAGFKRGLSLSEILAQNPAGIAPGWWSEYTAATKDRAEINKRQIAANGWNVGKVKKMGDRWGFRYWGKPKEGIWNPASASAEVFEEFHGFAPDEVVTVSKKVHHHAHLAALGTLVQLDVYGVDGRGHKITGFKGALLACNESRDQLFVEGGDQSMSLADFGIRKPHETETLGRVTNIGYKTNKTHLGDEGGEAVYVHRFRAVNQNGKHVVVKMTREPDLIYDVRNEQLLFSGGSYEILREGINK
jgi:hypothetical protein